MFKITIDNKEVITDKDFTIEEEMLNTPSVILNNVYPKEWETEKDYLNFYHPNEYSKCKIYDEEITPASEGSTVEGTDFSITYDDTKEFSLLSLKGDTSQETTTGKNLNPTPYANGTSKTTNGITFSVKNDGTIVANGTATATAYFYMHTQDITPYWNLPKGNYTLSGCASGGASNKYFIGMAVYNDTTRITGVNEYGSGTNFNTTSLTYNRVLLFISISSGQVCNNLTFKPMVRLASITDNTYEPYTNGASPNPNYPQEVQTVSGRQEVEIVGKNLFDKNTSIVIGKTWTSTGTETNLTNCFVQESYIPATPSTAYTISTTNDYSSTTDFRLMICEYDTNKNFIRRNIGTVGGGITTKYTITTSSTAHYVRLGASTITIDELQFEKGNQATTYEEYKGQTYELDLGKNMLSLTNNQTITSAGITAQVQHGWIILNGTATAISTIRFPINSTIVYADESYTLSANNTSQVSGSGIILSVGNTADSYTQTNFSSANAKRTFKKDSATTYNRLTISTASGTTYHNYIIKPQLEKGTKATEYSDYKEPIELCKIGSHQDRILKNTGLNLYDKDAGNILSAYFNASQTTIANNSANRMIYIPCKPNTTYTLSKIRSAQFNIGYTKELPTENVQVYGINTSPTFYNNNSWYYFTITTPADAQYIVSRIYQTAQDTTITLDQVLGTIQLEEGNTPSDYEPFGSGSWYLYKAINKVVLNGSETIGATSQYLSIGRFDIHTYTDGLKGSSGNPNCLSNYYKASFSTNDGDIFISGVDAHINIMNKSYINDLNGFKTWLSQHPTSVYYVLATPTTEIIEDTDLLKQLDAISLLNGINYITVSSPNLVAPLKIHYNFNEEVIDQELYFCGVVKNSGNISLNPREPHFQSLQVLSYKTFLSEGETLDFVIYEKTIREAIEQVVSAISDYGFIVGDINILNPDEIIGAYSTKDKSAYDVFQYIADITQSRWTTRMIDEDTIAIDFYDPTLMELGTTIDYTKEFFEENLIDNMFYSYGTNDYRNKQVMTSQQVYSNINQTQNIVANGYQTQFNTEQNIGKINSILVDNVSYSFATNTEKEMGVSADFYYSAGNNYIESASAISVGKVITIDYLPIVEGRQIITNAYEIDRVANSTGVKGVVARYENRNDAITSTELQLIGQSYIKYKGTPEIILTVVSRKDLWNVGQRVPFNAPIDELATEYMVRKKAVNRITTIDTLFYTYELTSSFNSETAVNYFDNQRAKANGNIGDGEYISRNIDIESQARIVFYGSSATVITTTGDNKLNCALESPFVE